VAFFRNLKITLDMIKWEHSIFALPFALCGAMLAGLAATGLDRRRHGCGAFSRDGVQSTG
jgi:4-hydroxybenzoate polyprenyltransferase